MAAQCAPQIVLMDMIMPIMDGVEATRRLRQMPGMERAVIIAISASISDERQHECLCAGCQAFVSKPFRLKTLFSVLSEYAGIEWVCGESEAEPRESAPRVCRSGERLSVPPPAELARLHQLARAGMITRLRKELDRLTEQHPESREFLRTIRDLLKEFQIEDMQRFIHAHIEEGNHGGDACHSDY